MGRFHIFLNNRTGFEKLLITSALPGLSIIGEHRDKFWCDVCKETESVP